MSGKSGKKSAKVNVTKALKTALRKGDSHFSANGKTYKIAKDAGIIEVSKGKKH